MSMSRARAARRIAAAAAYGGGGIGLLGGAAAALLVTEMSLARRVIGEPDAPPPDADGRYGYALARRTGQPPLLLGFLGDSTAAGQGVARPGQTPGALLATGLAAVAERPVDLRNAAVSGARSDDLERQVRLLLGGPDRAAPGLGVAAPGASAGGRSAYGGLLLGGPPESAGRPESRPLPAGGLSAAGEDGFRPRVPDLCVIMVGANDVTHRVPPARSVRLLTEAVRTLRAAGSEVVVGTCPDLGTIEPVYQPLRWVARRLSRQLAAAQTIAVVGEGGRAVSLGDLLGPEFAARPRELFGPDSYHPSAEGYATVAAVLLPSLCAALGLWPDAADEAAPEAGVLPVAQAAAEAAAEGGTEVTAARGPWARLLRRRRHRHGLPAEAAAPARADASRA
ncbi:SGNH/GDSL hydrolase family protein [Streptomyces sp. B1866]|uniref:SGNH/GDSL hydrolase family protein n=1 Tax=Streptomyces sp. B1866 TaxID=3075431 RepID=UPI0028925884|nr:SGNH/GDSL hydrolase family protein [Streptomyces sp. B1866]MDT3395822.1 SGNH/GDSL hydrolase family protein [Streptomyces sp. B1866]